MAGIRAVCRVRALPVSHACPPPPPPPARCCSAGAALVFYAGERADEWGELAGRLFNIAGVEQSSDGKDDILPHPVA